MTDFKLHSACVVGFVGVLGVPSLARTEGAQDDYRPEDYRPALVALRLGPSVAYFDRHAADGSGALGALADVQLGFALTPRFATGVGVRGAWFFPTDLNLAKSSNLQLLQGTAYWFEQFETGEGNGFRLSLGPTLSTLYNDGEPPVTESLVGAEVAFEFRLDRFLLTERCSHNVWLGGAVSAAFGFHAHDEVKENDREVMGKLFLSIAVESVPNVPEPDKAAVAKAADEAAAAKATADKAAAAKAAAKAAAAKATADKATADKAAADEAAAAKATAAKATADKATADKAAADKKGAGKPPKPVATP
jgi:hypothetical protein